MSGKCVGSVFECVCSFFFDGPPKRRPPEITPPRNNALTLRYRVHDKEVTCKDHVNWGYALYSSTGSFSTSFDEPMRLGDVKSLFGTMVRTVHYGTMVELTDAAWTEVAGRDSECKAMIKKTQRQKKSMDDLKISHRIFLLLLGSGALKPLFEPARSWGRKDEGTWTYVMEEEYYHPELLGFVMSERRRVKVEGLAERFLSEKSLRYKKDALKLMKNYVYRRNRARFLMTENIVRYEAKLRGGGGGEQTLNPPTII